jgi:hypothetical protein
VNGLNRNQEIVLKLRGFVQNWLKWPEVIRETEAVAGNLGIDAADALQESGLLGLPD